MWLNWSCSFTWFLSHFSMFLWWIIKENGPGGQLVFIGPGVGVLNLLFAQGVGNSPIKKAPGGMVMLGIDWYIINKTVKIDTCKRARGQLLQSTSSLAKQRSFLRLQWETKKANFFNQNLIWKSFLRRINLKTDHFEKEELGLNPIRTGGGGVCFPSLPKFFANNFWSSTVTHSKFRAFS